MFELAKSCVTRRAQQSADLAGIVAVIDVQPRAIRGAFADGAAPSLGSQHLVVGSEREPGTPAKMAICMILAVFLSPLTLICGVLARISLAVFGLGFYRTRLADVRHAIPMALVRSETVKRQRLLAAVTFLHALRSGGAWMWSVVGGLFGDMARFAVRRQAVLLLVVDVKFADWLSLLANKAGFFHRVPLRLSGIPYNPYS